MTPNICFLVIAQVRDHARRFYSNCRTLKTCTVTAGIKKYQSIIKKKKKKHGKIVLLTKSILNSMEVLISKAFTDLNISHDELVLINNVLKKFYHMREEIKIPITNKSLSYI